MIIRRNIILAVLAFFFSHTLFAEVIYQDDFESSLLANYEYNNNSNVVITSSEASQGQKCLSISPVSYVRTRTAGDSPGIDVLGGLHDEMWVEFDVKITGQTGWYDYFPVPYGQYSENAISVRAVTSGASAGKFRLAVVDNVRVSGSSYEYYGQYDLNSWHHFLIGIKMSDTSTGDGSYSIYYDTDGNNNWQSVADEIAYVSNGLFTNSPGFGRVQAGMNQSGSQQYIDDLKVYDSIPFDIIEPKDFSDSNFNVQVTASGGMNVTVGPKSWSIKSFFTEPGQTAFLKFGESSGWTPQVEILSPTSYKVTAANNYYTLERVIEVYPNHIKVFDNFTNDTASLIGIKISNEAQTSFDCDGFKVIGLEAGSTWEWWSGPRPHVHARSGDHGLGMIVRDNVYREQAKLCAYPPRIMALKDDHFGLDANDSYTMKWEIYPVQSSNYYDFINTVRLVWQTNDHTIPGRCGFVSPLWKPQWNNNQFYKEARYLTTEEMQTWLEGTNVHAVAIVVIVDSSNIYDYTIEAFGEDYLNNADGWIARHTSFVSQMKAAKPDLKVVPYFHFGLNPINSAYDQSKATLSDGTHRTFTNTKGHTRGYYYPTVDNAFGQLMRQVFRATVNDFGQNGFYFDETNFMTMPVPNWMGYVSDWDGHTVEMDSNNNVIRTMTCSGLITRPIFHEFTDELIADNKLIWANTHPMTEEDSQLPINYFVENVTYPNHSYAHLTTPIGYGGKYETGRPVSNQSIQEDAYNFLQYGILYGIESSGLFGQTQRCVINDYFPMTPQQLYEGYVIGSEKIITSKSGVYGFDNNNPLFAVVYGTDGLLKDYNGSFITIDNKSYWQVELAAGEIAVISQDPYCGMPGTTYLPADVSGPQGEPDCYVDLYDLTVFGVEWLYCNDPQNSNCVTIYE